MGILGDLFPEHERQKYIGSHLEPGQVLFLFCKFTNPQKEKYLVVVCTGKRPFLLIINSRIHPFIAKRPDLLKCQVKLSASDYDFLDHDSFVDCSKVIDHFRDSEIREQLLADIGRVKGELNAYTISDVVRAVQSAKTISAHHKNKIVDSLK